MKKLVKKLGNSKGVIFDREECKINKIEVGDMIDIPDEIFDKTKKK